MWFLAREWQVIRLCAMCICNVTDSIDSLEMFELLCIQN
ncbi:hypothetical protein ADUPG1_014853, partial [Aduncisulcus paluster]